MGAGRVAGAGTFQDQRVLQEPALRAVPRPRTALLRRGRRASGHGRRQRRTDQDALPAAPATGDGRVGWVAEIQESAAVPCICRLWGEHLVGIATSGGLSLAKAR